MAGGLSRRNRSFQGPYGQELKSKRDFWGGEEGILSSRKKKLSGAANIIKTDARPAWKCLLIPKGRENKKKKRAESRLGNRQNIGISAKGSVERSCSEGIKKGRKHKKKETVSSKIF